MKPGDLILAQIQGDFMIIADTPVKKEIVTVLWAHHGNTISTFQTLEHGSLCCYSKNVYSDAGVKSPPYVLVLHTSDITWNDLMSEMVYDVMTDSLNVSRAALDDTVFQIVFESEHGYTLEDVAEALWAFGNCVIACREDDV